MKKKIIFAKILLFLGFREFITSVEVYLLKFVIKKNIINEHFLSSTNFGQCNF